jgi:hypothetical protein
MDGFGEDVDRQRYFTPYDLNLGNVMVAEKEGQRRYTHIDFERSRLDSLESLLFKRWAQAGVYDHNGSAHMLANGRNAELELLGNAYVTLKTLCKVNGGEVQSFDEFRVGFRKQKKRHLLRLARRYKEFEEGKKGEVDSLRAHKRFFYTMFVNEVWSEGKISGKDDAVLGYLNTLFESPLSDEEMKQAAEKYDPCFRSSEELNPLSVKDVASKNKELIDKYNAAKRKQKARRLAIGLAIPTLLAAVVGTAVALGVKSKEADELSDRVDKLDYRRAEYGRYWNLSSRSSTLGLLNGVQRNEGTINGKYLLEELKAEFGDEETAMAAFIDYNAVYEAVQENGGRTDWETIEPYIQKHYFDVFSALYDSEGHVDNIFLSSTTDQNMEAARRYLTDLKAEAEFRYKEMKSGHWNHCIFQGYGLSGLSEGSHTDWSWTYECVPDPERPGSVGQEPITLSGDEMPDFWAAHDDRR